MAIVLLIKDTISYIFHHSVQLITDLYYLKLNYVCVFIFYRVSFVHLIHYLAIFTIRQLSLKNNVKLIICTDMRYVSHTKKLRQVSILI